MDSYLDSSFLLKLYMVEPDSATAVDWLARNRGNVFVSSLSDVEVATVLYRVLPGADAARALESYRQDLASGIFQKLEMDVALFERAAALATAHSHLYKLRSLDVLHLATAMRYGVRRMGVYDKRLRDAALGLGLVAVP